MGEIQDFVPIGGTAEAQRHRLIRRVVCVRGSMPFRAHFSPRFDYGMHPHTVTEVEAGVHRDKRSIQPARCQRRVPGSPADGCGRAIRRGQDRARPGEPGPSRASAAARVGAARACRPPRPSRHPPGRPDRRLTDRAERAVHTRDLRRGVRPDPPPVCRVPLRAATALEAGPLLVQHTRGQCPTCCGLGHIDLDVQYLPDIAVQCPTCHGSRFTTPRWPSRSTG